MLDVQSLRAREFPWMEPGAPIFLNAASTGPMPARCIAAVEQWTRRRATPHELSDELLFSTLARSRQLIAQMIGAAPREIALATNTGYGINLAARALPLARGDVILTPDLEFPANVYPWWAAANERGLEYRRLPLSNGVLDEDALLGALEDGRVRVVSVSWIDSASGGRVNLARIGGACRARGIWFVVDAIQGVGACPLDVKAANVDILACGAQKWLLSPWGSGFVYVRDDLARALEPPVVSWMAPRGTDDFRRLREYDMTWRDDARRFELITLPFQDFAGMNASLELFFELGLERVYHQIETLATQIVEWALAHGVPLVTPADSSRRGGVLSVCPEKAEQVSARLTEQRVVHSYREGAIRLSPHVYNTGAELRQALAIIAS
ncbi:MAG TPA: aminotransferase class V-fold PLP-dependent enzyme [Burkholderiales bacterium]|nr:aminotransferase class V-fold PLP-dependent enzyme [Burkholderiales bacterium]